MPITAKQFKNDVLAGEPKFGLFLNTISPPLTAAFSHSGYDWLLIDAQHSPVDNSMLLGLIHAVHTGPAKVMVRVAGTHDRTGIQQAADCGADGILIPYVNDAKELRQAVETCYYPMQGTRSSYVYGAEANAHMIVAFQVETAACVDNVEEIMKVPGVHIAFVGPFDLCLSLGLYHNNKYVPPHMFTSPEYFAALSKTEAAAKKNNVALGIFLGDTTRVEEFLKRGYRFIATGSDLLVALAAAGKQMEEITKITNAQRLKWKKSKL